MRKTYTKESIAKMIREEAQEWAQRLEILRLSGDDEIDALIPSETHYRLMYDQAIKHAKMVRVIKI